MNIQRTLQQHQTHITGITGALIAIAFVAKWSHFMPVYTAAMIIASVIAAAPIAVRAWAALKVKVISIELLVTIAVVGAFLIGEYNESAIVTFLFLFGSYLEQKTLAKTRASIRTLTEMAPTTAMVVQPDGTTEEVDVDDVDEGDVVLVKTGGAIPVDGVVVSGTGYTDEAAITGESREIEKKDGSQVFSGTIVTDGFLKVEATKVGDDTTFAKIVELVEEAQDTKSHAEKFIDQFAKYYTPAVLVLALLVFLISRNVKLAITVLVLGCPGALVIGAPVSNVAGIGNGAKRGILIKGGEAMDQFAKVDTFVFDKTGTLTKGQTAVSQVKTYTGNEAQMWRYASRLEALSDHPLARAIVTAASKQQLHDPQLTVNDQVTVKGQGVSASIEGHSVVVGNAKLMANHQVSLSQTQQADLTELQATGSSVVLVAIDGQLQAIIGVADIIREGVAEQLAALKQAGAKQLVMLTGDNQVTADYVAKQLGIDTVYAELMPEDKVTQVKALQAAGRKVAFIGDGINDSPALATADIGIAMGSGTDVAIDTSDVVLMQSSFSALVHAYRLAKKTVLNTKENIFIAIAVVAFLLLGLVAGFIYMASGMLVHEASILVVILNAMRLIGFGGRKQEVTATQAQLS